MRIADETVICRRRAISKSYAKINLTLDVLSRMENGYHEIESVMQTVSLFDLVIVDRLERGIMINTNLKFLPTNQKNIAYKAAEAFFAATKINGGAKILIHKNIPVAAGLAGGSGNGAAVLACLNLLYGKPLSDDELLSLGATLGADVPFCLICGTQLCTGIGDKLTPIPSFGQRYILLVKPPIGISTAQIYNEIDSCPIPEHPTTTDFIHSVRSGDYNPELMFNVMQYVTVKQNPVIRGICEKLVANGAVKAMMSGSGPTVFGIFDDFKTAKASADSFSHLYKEVYLTITN